jgi:hypothetical protein
LGKLFVGLIIFAISLMAMLGPCLLGGIAGAAASVPFWGGIMAVGWVISSTALHKECPICAESAGAKSFKCKHCGHDFAGPSATSIAEPFYK